MTAPGRGDALRRLADALEAHGCTVRGSSAQCPAHEDRNASLSIGQGRDGAVIKCHAGCETDAVLEALGMSAADLFDEPRGERQRGEWTPFGDAVAVYDYTDEHGNLLFQVCRTADKQFPQRRPDPAAKTGWRWRLNGTQRVPYRLPRLIAAARDGGTVYVAEGEKDVHALEAAGAVATCNPGGAGKWRPEYAAYFAGADVVVIADRDEPGRRHAADVAASLAGTAKSVRVAEAADGKDAADHLGAGYGLDDFRPADPDTSDTSDSDTGQPDGGLAVIAAKYTPVDWTAAWKGQPEAVDWLIEPFLEAGTVNVLFAKAGTGKSLLALEWALRLVREGRTVVYIDDENRLTDVVERLQAFGADPGELARLALYSFAGLPALDTPAGGLHLLAVAATAQASLVILDTTTRMVQGRENDSDTFLQLYRCSLVPLKSRGITVLRLDHPGKNENLGQRGSNAKDGDADTIWKLTEVAQGRKYKLHRDKNRSGHAPDSEDVAVDRLYGPLRHEWTCPDGARETKIIGQVCGQLDRLGVPPSAGRDRCRTALTEAGIPVSNDLLSKVVRQRRFAPDSCGTAGQLSADAADCPPIRVSKTHGADRSGSHPSADSGEQWPSDSEGEAAQ